MIEFEGVTVRYPSAAGDAVTGVSLQVPRGRFTAVVGPNGSGKTTLVRALLGRVPVRAGRIRVDGDDAALLQPRELARRVAVAVQREDPAFPMTGRAYLALGRTPHARAWGADDREAEVVEKAATLADVTHLLDRRTDELSGGEWQRMRIARAVAQEAPSLVFDEPTTFLDVGHEMAAFELLAALARRGAGVLAVSHQLNLVSRFADEVVLLSRGAVAAAGSPAQVMNADILEPVYEWPLVISRDPAIGAPTLVPLRRTMPHND